MALPESVNTPSAGPPFGSDLHGFIEQYERAYPDEVLHIEEPLNAEWEISALAMKLEKAHRFPLLIFHNVIVDGERATMRHHFLWPAATPGGAMGGVESLPASRRTKRGNDRSSSGVIRPP
jgi:hypothetical protein